jgi:hypothetical protein
LEEGKRHIGIMGRGEEEEAHQHNGKRGRGTSASIRSLSFLNALPCCAI